MIGLPWRIQFHEQGAMPEDLKRPLASSVWKNSEDIVWPEASSPLRLLLTFLHNPTVSLAEGKVALNPSLLPGSGHEPIAILAGNGLPGTGANEALRLA